MTNVRLDQNGLPKGPIYDPTAPVVHRSAVTAVDAADPPDDSGAIDPAGYEECRLDLALTGVALTSLTVQGLFWNPRQGTWFGGAQREFTSVGSYALTVPCRGQKLFLKVTAFSGTSFSLNVDYALS